MRETNKSVIGTDKSATKTIAITQAKLEKLLAKVPEEKAFWSNDGRKLRDMKDLMDALADMSDQIFAYHSNAVKRDFSTWVREVLEDEKLAADLDAASNRERAAKIVEERYVSLSHKVVPHQ